MLHTLFSIWSPPLSPLFPTIDFCLIMLYLIHSRTQWCQHNFLEMFQSFKNSRLSLFRLSEVRTATSIYRPFDLAQNNILARCLLHNTHPEMRPLAFPYTGQCWLPQTRFSCNFIMAGYDVLGMVWQWITLETIIILEAEPHKIYIRGKVGFLAAVISWGHLAILTKLYCPNGDRIN